MQTNLSVQTVQINCGGEVGGGICKSVSNHTFANPPSHLSPAFANPPPTSPPQLVCTVCTERLVYTRYVPLYICAGQDMSAFVNADNGLLTHHSIGLKLMTSKAMFRTAKV